MKIPLTFMIAGLLAWVAIFAVYYSIAHHPVQSLIIPLLFLLHKLIDRTYFSFNKAH